MDSRSNWFPVTYSCPTCRRDLKLTDDAFHCADGHRYPIVGGVPVFLTRSHEEPTESNQRLARLNELAHSHGWRAALSSVFSEDPGTLRYVTDEDRLIFLDLIPSAPGSVVLEIGCSLGQVTQHLSRRVGCVCALEVVPEQAEFTALRSRQEGLENVQVACGGDDCRLPYPSSTFDLVVLNLVLEWCGARGSDSFLSAQERMIRECGRVLRTDGQLYIATKNRYSVYLLAGRRDEHTGNLPFGSALPSSLLSLLLRATGRSAKGRLYSFSQLRRSLQGAGFDRMEPYWAIPNPRFPIRIVPFDRRAIRSARFEIALRRRLGAATRLLLVLPLAALRHITPGLVFLARKAARTEE